ncbi:MAG: molybdenum cofactor biosynthesis protein MoaE [Methylococcaceae bacterium]
MVIIREHSLHPWNEIQHFQNEKLADKQAHYGATASFVGTMRDFNEDNDVTSMSLEYYPGMTEKQLEKSILDAFKKWQCIDALIVHRVGTIKPGEPIVLVAVWSTHRGDAFDACRFLMENLKSKAPFWKKEQLADQSSRWVHKNTDGYVK